jgi:erythromycin esterase-like protein
MDEEKAISEIRKIAMKLENMDDLDVIVKAAGDAEVVLLGEASHGTSEFYVLRAEISKRLIAEKGFSFIAVEGDWPSCFTLNQYIKQKPGAPTDVREILTVGRHGCGRTKK